MKGIASLIITKKKSKKRGTIKVEIKSNEKAYQKGIESEFIKNYVDKEYKENLNFGISKVETESDMKKLIAKYLMDFKFLTLAQNRHISIKQRHFAEDAHKYLRLESNQNDTLLAKKDSIEINRILRVLEDPHSLPKALVHHALKAVFPNYEQFKISDITRIRKMQEHKKIKTFINNIVFSPEDKHNYRGRRHTFQQQIEIPIGNFQAESKSIEHKFVSNIWKKLLYIGSASIAANSILAPSAEKARLSVEMDKLHTLILIDPCKPAELWADINKTLTSLDYKVSMLGGAASNTNIEIGGVSFEPIVFAIAIILLVHSIISGYVDKRVDIKNLESKNSAVYPAKKLRMVDEAVTGHDSQGRKLSIFKKLGNSIQKNEIHKMEDLDTSRSRYF